MPNNTILIVDDEPSVLTSLYRALHSESWEVLTELSGEQALVRMRERPIKVLISDGRMVNMQGAELLTTAKIMHPQTVRILLTGYVNLESVINVINYCEVFRLLTKPWNDDTLKMIVHAALNKYDRQQKVLRVFKMFDDNPVLLPFIEHNYPRICSILKDKRYALSDPDLNNDELQEVMRLLTS
jgi:two-component system probable response regulator PhcQ